MPRAGWKAAEITEEWWFGWVSTRRNREKQRGSGDLGKLLADNASELLEISAEGVFVLQLVAHLMAQQTPHNPCRHGADEVVGLFGRRLGFVAFPWIQVSGILKLLCAGKGS